MVKVVQIEEFYQNTFGGRPCQLDTSIYAGVKYDCGCGSSHAWDPYMMPVIRELPMLKLVIDNPSCGYVTFVKIKGFFKYRFESIVSCLNRIEKPQKKIKKNTITKKTKKTKKVLKKKKVK